MLTIDQFMAGIAENEARIRAYKLKCDGTGGNCDCIGLIIGAVRLAGGSWPWTHGSNYTARYLLADGIRKDAPLQLGDLVFKARAPGEAGYALPSRYKDSPDRLDYYHVGVVTRINPLCITHCTSVPGGIKRDSTRGKWLYSGWLRMVEREDERMSTAKIISPNGGKVNMRKEPRLSAALICQLAPETEVVVLGTVSTGWTHCRCGEKTGYVMSQYVDDGDGGGVLYGRVQTIRALIEEAQEKLNAADAALNELITQ